jgi:CheY-like chemotaxis protein
MYASRHDPAVRSGRYVMLSVRDTGCGMDKQTQLRVFEPFFTTKGPGRGTGLGLSTVYGIVKQSNGYVWVYSEPGNGATFKVYFPRVDEAAQPLIRPEVEKEVGRGTESILLVEDDDGLRLLATNLLSRHGYRILEAKDGESAIAISRHYADGIDMLLTDVIMPGMNGAELAARLRHLRPHMKVLYMSGYTGRIVRDSGLVETEVNLLSKPFTRRSLLSAVRTVIDFGKLGS